MTSRRIVATQSRIEQCIAAGQSNGLTPQSVEMYPDGKVVIHFGGRLDATLKENPKPKGWNIAVAA